MASFRTVIISRLTPEEAFERMVAFDRVTEWDPTVVEARRHDEGRPRLGTRFHVVSKFGGSRVALDYELVALEPPHRFTVEARNASFASRDTITVELRQGGSAVTYDARLTFRGWKRMLDPLMQMLFRGVGRKAEAGLQAFLNP